jgi:hypothetical protein
MEDANTLKLQMAATRCGLLGKTVTTCVAFGTYNLQGSPKGRFLLFLRRGYIERYGLQKEFDKVYGSFADCWRSKETQTAKDRQTEPISIVCEYSQTDGTLLRQLKSLSKGVLLESGF